MHKHVHWFLNIFHLQPRKYFGDHLNLSSLCFTTLDRPQVDKNCEKLIFRNKISKELLPTAKNHCEFSRPCQLRITLQIAC